MYSGRPLEHPAAPARDEPQAYHTADQITHQRASQGVELGVSATRDLQIRTLVRFCPVARPAAIPRGQSGWERRGDRWPQQECGDTLAMQLDARAIDVGLQDGDALAQLDGDRDLVAGHQERSR